MKTFNTRQNIGKAKYVVNHHDGIKQHADGSPFFDVSIFSNKKRLNQFVSELRQEGYDEQG